MSDTDFSLFEGHPRATYGGVLDPVEIPRVMSEHDLLLFPSYCRSDGLPGAILEAFQCGVPVIAAIWGGVPELVDHEKNGLLVKPRSAAAVKAAIERLLDDPRPVPAAVRGSAAPGGILSQRELVWPHGFRPAQPVRKIDSTRGSRPNGTAVVRGIRTTLAPSTGVGEGA